MNWSQTRDRFGRRLKKKSPLAELHSDPGRDQRFDLSTGGAARRWSKRCKPPSRFAPTIASSATTPHSILVANLSRSIHSAQYCENALWRWVA